MAKLALKGLMFMAAAGILAAAIFILAKVILIVIMIALIAGALFLALRPVFRKRDQRAEL